MKKMSVRHENNLPPKPIEPNASKYNVKFKIKIMNNVGEEKTIELENNIVIKDNLIKKEISILHLLKIMYENNESIIKDKIMYLIKNIIEIELIDFVELERTHSIYGF